MKIKAIKIKKEKISFWVTIKRPPISRPAAADSGRTQVDIIEDLRYGCQDNGLLIIA